MKKSRKHRAGGGDIAAFHRETMNPSRGISVGVPTGVRARNLRSTPAYQLNEGMDEGQRRGPGARALAMGMPGGRRRFATGGHASEMDEPKGERLRKTRQRNDVLGSPHYAKGGKVHQTMKALYHALHSHFENEPQMKKLGATSGDVYQGEPHRYSRSKGGKLWIQGAINPAHKGALHESLHVPKGKKIPMAKIQKAEHSKSPILRKRAHLAATLRKFHP